MNYEGTPEKVRELLIESSEPLYHEEIKERLRVPESYVGSALMELYDEDKADWPAADEWIALPDEERTIQGAMATIRIGVVHD